MYSMLRETYLVPQHCQNHSLPQLLIALLLCAYAAADICSCLISAAAYCTCPYLVLKNSTLTVVLKTAHLG